MVQGRLLQSMPQWHIDYFELKSSKKWLMWGGHFDPPLCPSISRREMSHVTDTLSASRSRRTSLPPKTGNLGARSFISKICYITSLIFYTKPKLFLFFYWFSAQSLFVPSISQKCCFFFFFFFAKKYKNCSLGCFLGPIAMRPLCAQIKICFLFSC